nr:replication protein A 70 kDa DNA-binding subunit D-like [Ipomoea batatas]
MGMYCVANELSTFKNKSAMKLRVIRTYLVPLRRGSLEIKSQEIVFHDSEGTVIHAHVPKTLVENFSNRLLLETSYFIYVWVLAFSGGWNEDSRDVDLTRMDT